MPIIRAQCRGVISAVAITSVTAVMHILSPGFQLVRRHYAHKYICMDICIKLFCCSWNNLHILDSFNNAGLLLPVGCGGGSMWGIFLRFQTSLI